MKLIRYNQPSSFLSDWDSFFADPYRAFAPFFRSTLSSARESAAPLVEWYEDDENYYAQVDLPGISKKELKVDAEDGLLRLVYESHEESSEKETRDEQFEHVLRCPEGVDVGKACANLKNGVLRLTLPKAEQNRPVSIQVK
ncbi:MAG: Hsp20/alpha crystallin family protein [Verrucomicrobiales bacterium]|jgi:HSP20 family protein|nr:Hsp20/alpha crystallin family protein [Verrucomicrobiales bacterium]